MNINKTADECLVESASVLFKCFVDPNFSIKQKQKITKWLICFFDYQDAINNSNQKQINLLKQKLIINFAPIYYKNALREFKIANFFYRKKMSLKDLGTLFLDYSTKQTIKTVTTLSNNLIKTFQNHNINVEKEFTENFQVLIYTIHYHLSYIFRTQLEKTVRTFIDMLKTKVLCKKLNQKIIMIKLIFRKYESYFSKIQEIQLINFIYKIDDIFQTLTKINEIDQQIINLIFNSPKKLNTSMHTIFKENNIDIYKEIWIKNQIDEKKTKLIMHLFAYETYFVQGYGNEQIYEELVLKNVLDEEKYWIVFHKYKLSNKIKK